MKGRFRILLLAMISLSACQDDDDTMTSESGMTYLHLSHTRLDVNPLIDDAAAEINYGLYDVVMLGGDLAQSSSADDETMIHLDTIFDLSDETTLWSLGNHDYSDLDRIMEYTDRLPYYAYHSDGVTFVVLDTQDSLSHIKGNQLDFFNDVVDTIASSSHLIVMSHKLIWMPGNAELEPMIEDVANGEFDSCNFCTNPNNFYQDLYPSLVELEEKNVEVICIGGDIGTREKSFSHRTAEGIDLLASGIESGDRGNQALVFEYDMSERQLTWEFVDIEEL